MRILITGGLGYIGSHLICKLVCEGHHIIIIDNLSNTELNVINKIYEITQKPKLIKFYHISLLNKEELNKIFEENEIFDVCFHLAQKFTNSTSTVNPLNIYAENLNMTINILECIKKFQCEKFIYISDSRVYSVQKKNVSETDLRGQNLENSLIRSFYFQEEIIHDFSVSNNITKVCIIRINNLFGRHFFLKLKHSGFLNLFHSILNNYKNKSNELYIFGNDYPTKDNTSIKCYIHIMDLCNILNIIVNKELVDSFTDLNISMGQGFSDLELINIANKTLNVVFKYKIKKRRNGIEDIFVLNTSKANFCFNWNPIWTFEKAFNLEYFS